MNIVQRFKKGLQKSSTYLTTNIIDSLKSNRINDATIDEIESILISADIGLDVTNQLIEKIKQTKNNKITDNSLILYNTNFMGELYGANYNPSLQHSYPVKELIPLVQLSFQVFPQF